MSDLVSVEQREVEFYDDNLLAVKADDGQVYVAISQMCDSLGIDTQAQSRRIRRDEILEEGFKGVANLTTPGGLQRGNVLRVDLIPLWLSGVRVSAVREEVRPKLARFQREAAKVLWEAFQTGRLTNDVNLDELLATNSPAAQAYRLATAMMRLAEQQLFLEARLDSYEVRLENVEAALGEPGRFITPGQASQISQAVKAIAMKLSDRSGRNEYGGVYGELYRRFEIVAYRELPAGRFQEAMSFLRDWHQRLTGESPF